MWLINTLHAKCRTKINYNNYYLPFSESQVGIHVYAYLVEVLWQTHHLKGLNMWVLIKVGQSVTTPTCLGYE